MKPRALFPSSAPSIIATPVRSSSVVAAESHQNSGEPNSNFALEKVNGDSHDNRSATAVAALRCAIEQLEKSCEMVSALQLESDNARTQHFAHNEDLTAQIETLQSELNDASELIEFLEDQNKNLERDKARLQQRMNETDGDATELGDSSGDKLLQQMGPLFDLHTEDLAEQIVKAACEILGAEVGVLTDSSAIDAAAMRGLDGLPPLMAYELFEFTQLVRQGKVAVIENDPENTPKSCEFFNLIALPFAAQHENGGVLLLANKSDGDFTEADSHRLQQLEQQMIIALENARFYREREERYNETVSALADAIETRNAYTGGRAQSIMLLAVEVGKKLDLKTEQLEEVRQAALLHAIGKVGVPDGILLNTGRLNDEEQKIMRTYPVIGCDLVLQMPHLHFVADAILYHHEKWDGSGYPSGLAAEKIPVAARIVGAVNAFEAMTTPRLYRQAVSAQEALDEMKRCAGTQFDPKIVDVLEKILQESQKTNDHFASLAERVARPRPDALKRSQEQSNHYLQVIEQEELEQAQEDQQTAATAESLL